MESLGAHDGTQPGPWGFAPGATPIAPAPGNSLLGEPAMRSPSCPLHSGPQPAWSTDAASDACVEDPEVQLARLAGAVGPLRRVLAAIAERLIATKAPERLCYARLGDYARERAGLSARQLQELARVHRALAGLPGLGRALLTNELPWSKVRLLTRVATKQDEAAWIARARAISTHQLEQEVRESARSFESEEPDDAEPQKRITLHCTPAVREKWQLVRELAERVAGQRLRAGEALELVAAEVFSAVSIDPAFAERPDEAPALLGGLGGNGKSGPEEAEEEPAALAARASARELPRAVASLAAGLREADAFELDRRLCLAVRLEQALDAAIAPLLRVVTCAEYEWNGDFQTLSSYAREQLGMSASKARALLRLERAGDVCPELRRAYRAGRLSWVKAQCLLPLFLLDIEGEWRPVWVAWAQRVTVRRLAADVERALLLRAGHHFAWQRCKFHPQRAQDPIPPAERQMCAPEIDTEATQQLAWRVPRDVALLFFGVRETLRSRLWAQGGRWLREGEFFDALLDCALLAWSLRDSRAGPPDPVFERDGYCCAVPGCTSRRNLHDHHIRFRSAGGSDAPGNRITLCAFHHQRGLHTGLLGVSGRAPDRLVFELGLRPGAPPLARYRSGDIVVPQQRPRAARGRRSVAAGREA
jgi:hypothetical protein